MSAGLQQHDGQPQNGCLHFSCSPLGEVFPFEYQGGGYFRRKGVPKGIAAEILHGQQAIEWLYAEMTKTQQGLDTYHNYQIQQTHHMTHEEIIKYAVSRGLTNARLEPAEPSWWLRGDGEDQHGWPLVWAIASELSMAVGISNKNESQCYPEKAKLPLKK